MFDLAFAFVRQRQFDEAEAPDALYRSVRSGRLFKVKASEVATIGGNPYSSMALRFTASHCGEDGKALASPRGPSGRAIARGWTVTFNGVGDYEQQVEAARISALEEADRSADLEALRARL